jgi:hypothetical protein
MSEVNAAGAYASLALLLIAFVLSLRNVIRERRRERRLRDADIDRMLATGMRSTWRRGLLPDDVQ